MDSLTKIAPPSAETLQNILAEQRAAFTASLPVAMDVRKDRIERAMRMVYENSAELCAALSADFGHRSHEQSMMTDITMILDFGRYCLKNMEKWAKAEKRHVRFPLGLLGARARVEYQPLGVIGIIAPWNFPVQLCIIPAITAFAAGNSVMVKNSEYTERTSELLATLAERYFDRSEAAFFTGGPEVGQEFSGLKFDHLMFTGATSVGHHIMAAAAKNLVPVTLELGGKSPTIVGRSADLERVARRIITGKLMNAGQICTSPDYLFVPKEHEADMVVALENAVAELYPTLLANDDYTSVVNERHVNRLKGYLEDAKEKGADIITVNPAKEKFPEDGRKMPLNILRNVNDDMKVMKDEIFGPILPIMTYNEVFEAIDYVNAHERPLALYYFGDDSSEEETVLSRTISGGVTVNDTIFHVAMDDLPFGGVGHSGMGAYHGVEGFKTFSHAKAIYSQPRIDVAKLGGFLPPYGKETKKAIKMSNKI